MNTDEEVDAEIDDTERNADRASSPQLVSNNDINYLVIEEEYLDQRDDDEHRRKKIKLNASKPEQLQDQDGIDNGSHCMICYTEYSNSGPHRLCCLKCGHLFGESCILHWLKKGCHHTTRRCPTCNKKTSARDIRVLYARNIIAADTMELNSLRLQLQEAQLEKSKLTAKLSSADVQIQLQKRLIESLKEDLNAQIKSKQTVVSNQSGQMRGVNQTSIRLSNTGGCRVLAYNRFESLLIASLPSNNPLFPGYGIRKINTENNHMSNIHSLFKKPIRDAVFSTFLPNILLCVSTEGCSKLMDINNNCTIKTFQVPDPLWSCCWSENEPFKFYCGSQNGIVYAYDQRYPNKAAEKTIDNTIDKTGVISIHSVKSKPGRALHTGGLIVCKLNSVYTCEICDKPPIPKLLPAVGSFTSMRFNSETDHMLLTAKPGARAPTTRHMLYRLSASLNSDSSCELVNTFYGSRCCPLELLRSSFITYKGNLNMIAAHDVFTGYINLWDIQTQQRTALNARFSDTVLDMCSFERNNEDYLCCLTDKDISMIHLNE